MGEAVSILVQNQLLQLAAIIAGVIGLVRYLYLGVPLVFNFLKVWARDGYRSAWIRQQRSLAKLAQSDINSEFGVHIQIYNFLMRIILLCMVILLCFIVVNLVTYYFDLINGLKEFTLKNDFPSRGLLGPTAMFLLCSVVGQVAIIGLVISSERHSAYVKWVRRLQRRKKAD